MTKSYGQVGYEAGSDWVMANNDDAPEGGFAAWEDNASDHHAYWDAIGDSVRKHATSILAQFAKKYLNRNLATSRPGEVLMSFLVGRCEHYSENEAGEPGDRCELCGTATPIRQVALERAIAKHPDEPEDHNKCGVCGEFDGHRIGCPHHGDMP